MTLRVLHCIYDDPSNPWVGGGGAVRVRELYRRLVGRVEATVATGAFPGARDEWIDGIAYRRLGAPAPYAWSRLSYARAASRLLQAADYDAAVVDFSAYAPVVVPRGRPVGVTVHHLTGPTAHGRWGAAGGAVVAHIERRTLRHAHRVGAPFSVDAGVTALDLAALLEAEPDVAIVPAGVDDALFALARRPERWILALGRLDVYQKGLDVLLDAVALLRTRQSDVRLRIAGRGRDGERIRALIAARGLQPCVEVHGAVTDAERADLLARAAVQVMPSRFEGFGMAAAEAMAAGVPLVASDVGALREVVAPPRGGVLVPPGDAAALAAALGALLDDAAARASLGATARVAAERFRWPAVAERHLAFLARIAHGEATSAGRA